MIIEKLHLDKRNVYGRELIYPACDTSKALVELTGCKTFDKGDLNALRFIGFELVIRPVVSMPNQTEKNL